MQGSYSAHLLASNRFYLSPFSDLQYRTSSSVLFGKLPLGGVCPPEELVALLKKSASHSSPGRATVVDLNVSAISIHHHMTTLRFLIISLQLESQEESSLLWNSIVSNLGNIISIAGMDPMQRILVAFDLLCPTSSPAHIEVLKTLIRSSDIPFLESLSLRMWQQLRSSTRSPHERGGAQLIILAGEVQINPGSFTIKALAAFPSIRLSNCYLHKRTGRFFYEVEVLSEGLMQVGFADDSFRCDPSSGQGVGDHLHSW